METKAQRGGPETYRKGVGDPKLILGAKALLASQLVQQQKGRRQRRQKRQKRQRRQRRQRPAAPAAGASRQRRLLRAARWRAQGQAAGLPRAQQACWAQAVVAAVAAAAAAAAEAAASWGLAGPRSAAPERLRRETEETGLERNLFQR